MVLFQGDLRPVYLIDLAFDSATLRIWTRPFAGSFEGNTYNPIGGLTGGFQIRNSLDQTSSPDAAAQIDGNSAEIRALGVQEEFQQRPVLIRVGNIDANGEIEETKTIFRGVMTDIPIIDDADGLTASVLMESVFADLSEGDERRYSSDDLKLRNPGDTFFDLVSTVSTQGDRFGG